MIRTIDIRLNAAHPELPLPEATTYQGAPSTAFLRGVPKACGQWQITAVSVAVTFPDNSTTTRAAVLSAGDVWVATIPACATSGRTASGLRILADGIDENGDAVTGYVLGVADFAVATFGVAPAPGVTSYALRYFDNVPNPPHKGDVAKIANVLKYYDGTAWQVFADVDLSNYATKADATLTARYSQTPAFGAWTFAGFPAGMTDATLEYNTGADHWEFSATLTDETYGARVIYESLLDETDPNATSMEISAFDGPSGETISGTATRERTDIIGYILGSQTTKPVASETEAEALRTGKADKVASATSGNFAGLDASGNLTDSGKKPADFATAAQGAKADAPIQPATRDASNNITSFYAAYRDGALLGVGQFPSWAAHNLKADTADLRYALGTAITTGSAQMADRTINAVNLGANNVTATFPDAVTGKARDFLLLVTKAADATGDITITAPTSATIYGDSLAQTIATGETWLFGVTELAANVFLVKAEKMEVAS